MCHRLIFSLISRAPSGQKGLLTPDSIPKRLLDSPEPITATHMFSLIQNQDAETSEICNSLRPDNALARNLYILGVPIDMTQ